MNMEIRVCVYIRYRLKLRVCTSIINVLSENLFIRSNVLRNDLNLYLNNGSLIYYGTSENQQVLSKIFFFSCCLGNYIIILSNVFLNLRKGKRMKVSLLKLCFILS